MVGLILGCEIAFWMVIAAGLSTRYLLRKRRLGLALLALTPVVDLVLLIAAGLDLHRGAPAEFSHSLAAVYLGFSVAYGHRMIQWADVRFTHRFDGGPPPVKLYGTAYATACWKDVGRTAIAAALGSGILWLLTVVATGPTQALESTYRIFGIVLVIDALWAASYTMWPRTRPDAR
ncbi:hypothetical protein [Gordonia sp. (in: high G+C Gram-positive bacteria)]|uniref:hypothetical protein n=1 Tax=Gordonia sp. (in: high G+C Gram-positive bacteria) TaxID=84139 RepID=UPI00352784E8